MMWNDVLQYAKTVVDKDSYFSGIFDSAVGPSAILETDDEKLFILFKLKFFKEIITYSVKS